ncbi:MAG TPA: hypothetical protein VGL61_29765 [Kofleriaceae bacterium]|jgi:hypothetical protein
MAKGIASVAFGVGVALLVGGVASADPTDVPQLYLYDGNTISYQHPTGSWLDFGLMYGRFEPSAGMLMSTEFVRFGPRASITRHIYIGGEVDIGSLSTIDSSPSNNFARTASGEMEGSTEDPMSSLTGGTLASGKALIGAHMLAGPLSGAAEFAAGVRDFMTHDSIGQYKEGYFGGAYELHGRLDLWATHTLTIGALANVDLADRKDVSLGLVVGVHFIPYDGQRR